MNSIKLDKLLRDYDNNKLSHVYLIETNNQNFCIKEIITLVKKLSCLDTFEVNCNKCNLCSLIDKNESPNFFLIEPDGKNIKKSQVLDLKTKCSTMPVLSKNNVYIIKQTENLNASSANTLLKFVEEPYENCFGFFITNNKENVINTIRSRCEIISLKYENSSILDKFDITAEEYAKHFNNVLDYLHKVEIDKQDSIMYNKLNLDELYKEKENTIVFFNIILNIYNNLLKMNVSNDIIDEKFMFLKNLSVQNILKKLRIINNVINKLNYNLNIELVFDKFLIEMGEINE